MQQEQIQEEEYDFPYHHLVQLNPFSEVRHMYWGYSYAAYVEKVIDTLKRSSWKSLVDMGCGDAKVTIEVARRFPQRRVVGVDYSEKSLRFAKAFAPELEFVTHTEEKFDGFLLIEVLEHISPENMDRFLASLKDRLIPGGFGIITTPHINVSLNPKHYQHFSQESFQRTIEPYFHIEKFEYLGGHTLGVGLIQRALSNRFFILNWQPAVNVLYAVYKRRYSRATEKNARQVFAVVRRRD